MPLLIPLPSELDGTPWHVAERARLVAAKVIAANRRKRIAERVKWDDLYSSDPIAYGAAIRQMARALAGEPPH